jgi:hypothetical protein
MKKVRSTIEREIAVYDDVHRAIAAHRDLMDAGYRRSDLRLMDAPTARLTQFFDGPPIPEAVAGSIIGAFLMSTLAFLPALAALLDPFSVTFVPMLLVGAALGAIVSYIVADRSRPVSVRFRMHDDDYVLVVPVMNAPREHVEELIKRHRPRAFDRAA